MRKKNRLLHERVGARLVRVYYDGSRALKLPIKVREIAPAVTRFSFRHPLWYAIHTNARTRRTECASPPVGILHHALVDIGDGSFSHILPAWHSYPPNAHHSAWCLSSNAIPTISFIARAAWVFIRLIACSLDDG